MIRKIIGYILIGLLSIGSCFGIGYGIAYSHLKKNTSLEYVNSLKNEIRNYEELCDKYYLEITILNDTISNLKFEKLKNESAVSDYLVQIDYLNSQIAKLNDLLEIYKKNEESYSETISDLNAEIELLNSEIIKLNASLESLSESNQFLSNRIDKLYSNIEILESEIKNNLAEDEALVIVKIDEKIEHIEIVKKETTFNLNDVVVPENIEILSWSVNGSIIDVESYFISESTTFVAIVNEYILASDFYTKTLNQTLTDVLTTRAYMFVDDYDVDFANLSADIEYVKMQGDQLIVGFKDLNSDENTLYEVFYDVGRFNLDISNFKAEDLKNVLKLYVENVNKFLNAKEFSTGEKFLANLNSFVSDAGQFLNENVDPSDVYFEFVFSEDDNFEIYTINVLFVTENGTPYKLSNYGIIKGHSFVFDNVRDFFLAKFAGVIGASMEGMSSASGVFLSTEKSRFQADLIDLNFEKLEYLIK